MMSLRRLRRQFDWPLSFTTLGILTIALVNLWSVTRNLPPSAPQGLFAAQLGFLGAATVAFIIAAAVDYRVYERWAWAAYGVGVVLLVTVLLGGKVVKGSSRWLSFGPIGIQPSELAKVLVIVAMAKLLSGEPLDLQLRPSRFVGAALGIMALPMLLVAKQPDLGTALIIGLVATSMLLVAGIAAHWKVLSILGELAVLIVYFVRKMRSVDANGHGSYQIKRLLTFWDPSLDPQGAGYHARQGLIAVGSGQWFGKGWLHGTQKGHGFLPEPWTDFPFAVWAEEWGFVGCLVLLGLYLLLIFWIIHLAAEARDRFAQMVCIGVAALFFWQVFFNIGMVVGILPVVGVTAPLFSYGGSSLITMMIALGLVMNVSVRRFAY